MADLADPELHRLAARARLPLTTVQACLQRWQQEVKSVLLYSYYLSTVKCRYPRAS